METLTIQNNAYKLDEAGYAALNNYLTSIRTHFTAESEVVADIERACVEILDDLLASRTDKILLERDVLSLIQTLGTVETITEQADVASTPEVLVVGKQLYRDTDNRWIAGVASGLAVYFGIPAWTVRLAFLIALITPIPSIIPYIILWVLMPKTKTKADILRMHGQPVDLSSLSNQSGTFKKRVMTTAKTVGVMFTLLVVLGLMFITLMVYGAYTYSNEQMMIQAEPERNVYEYSCESGESLRILQAKSGVGNVMIVGEKADMHQGEYSLLYEDDSKWVYETPTFLELMRADDTWQFEIDKNDLGVTALNRHTEERDSCMVATMRPSAQNQPSLLENMVDFSAADSCLDAGNVWDATVRKCLRDE